jgi:hypothetical protein
MSERDRALSGFAEHGKTLQTRCLSPTSYGQNCPQRYPEALEGGNELLGAPLSIRDVARLIGCSPWTVRQSYLPQGLPYLRSGPHGKLVFFYDQIVRWILQHQQKGGKSK